MSKRVMSVLLLLAMLCSVFSGLTVSAVAAEPTSAAEVVYRKNGDYVYNWGKRDTTATFLTTYAASYYTGSYSFDVLSKKSGSQATGAKAIYESDLGKALHTMLASKQTRTTSYNDTKELYRYTDCQQNADKISSFYSGKAIGPGWGEGEDWNREHTWPNSKGLNGADENDIMMLRPTAVSENSNRGNDAYGESRGFYNPNEFNKQLHGDVARLMLQHLIRWGNTNKFYGSGGVLENRALLLKWLKEDPVDTWEMGRNDAVQSITGVRNVFVDYPELAFRLLGEEVPANYPTPSSGNSSACDHVWDAGKVTTEPTCTEAGVKTYTCSKCGNTKTEELPALGHIDENKDELCDRCGAKLGEDPKPTGNKYVKAASLKDGDEVVLYNPEQGKALSEEIVATYYKVGTAVTPTDGVLETSDTAIVWTVAADGTGFNLINDEGKKLSIEGTFNSIPYDKENDAWTVQTAATAGCVYVVNENGKYISWSSKGNFAAYTFDATKEADYALELYVKSTDAPHVHTWDEGKVTTEPTCTKAGVKTYTCTVCKETKTEAIAALGHKWDDGKVTTEPTCTEEGVKTYTCTVCKETKTEAIAALGHVDADKDNKCDRCGEKLGEDPKPTYSDFTDLDPNGWYHDGINYMIENGMMNGVGNGMFEPNGSVTRAMLVTILYRQAGSPKVTGDNPFEDVAAGKYYTDAVIWAFQNGIVNGTTPTTFEPEEPVTREQIATILYRQAGSPAVTETDLSSFLDASDVSSYAANAVRWAVSEGVIKGSTVATAEQLYTAALNELDQNFSSYSYHFADLNGDGFPALIANVPDFNVGTNYWMFFDVFNGEFVSLGYMEVDGQAEEEGFFVTDAGVLYYLDRRSDSSFEIYRIDQKADGSLDMKLVTDDYAYDETFVGEPAASYLESVGAHKLDTYYKQGGVPESFRNIKLLALYPKDTATRAEIATMLMRYLTK